MLRRGMFTAIACWMTGAALAWGPAEFHAVQGPESVNDVALGMWGETPALAWAGPEGVQLVAEADGKALLELPGATFAVVLRDLDADGLNDLLQCGQNGLVLARGADGVAKTLGSTPCDDVVVLVPEVGWPSLLVRTGSELRLWTPADGRIAETGVEGVVSETVGLAGYRGGWCVAQRDGTLRAQAGTRSTLDPGGPVAAMAWGPDGWTWLREDGTIGTLVGEVPGVDGARTLLGLRLGGRRALVAPVPDDRSLRLRYEGRDWVRVSVPVEPDRVAVGALDRDGCADLLVSRDDGQAAVVRGRCGKR